MRQRERCEHGQEIEQYERKALQNRAEDIAAEISRGVACLTEDNVGRHENLVCVKRQRAEEKPHRHKSSGGKTGAPRRALAPEKAARGGENEREGKRRAYTAR